MKMLAGHLAELKSLIGPLDTPELRARYIARDFPRADKTKNVDMRYRWDLLHAMPDSGSVCRKLYMYLNDTHIDTALKAIVPPLEGGEQGVRSTGWVKL